MNAAAVQQQLHSAISRHRSGDLASAAGVYASILKTDPTVADAWHLSGLIAWQRGAFRDAETLILKALELQPEDPDYLSNLASVLLSAGRPEEAESAARRSLASGRKNNRARQHLATALARQGRYEEAIDILQDILNDDPLCADAHCNLGAILYECSRFQEAAAALETAVELDPQSCQARLNLGGTLRELRQPERALLELDRAAKISPDTPQIWVNRGNVLLDLGDHMQAITDFQRALNLDPQSALALNGLGRALQMRHAWKEALEAFDLACHLDGPGSRFSSNRLYCSSLAPHLSPHDVFERHAEWGREIEARISVLPPVRYTHDRIRIGYVSPDLRNHATMRFVWPILRSHDRRSFDIYCYANCTPDSVSQEIAGLCTGWHVTPHLSDSELAALIRRDEIDVLIDLAGHTAGNRLPVFAARPAPLQMSFLGYPGTTGLTRIDAFLSDAVRIPDGGASLFTERLVCLPHGACCFEAPSALPMADPPALRNGNITLGSTHRLEKLSDTCLKLWARVLESIPDSRLLVIRDVLANDSTRSTLQNRLEAVGVDADRIEFCSDIPEDHLRLYDRIDLLLDVFPWGSGTTAYESMWMGVPIPTVLGSTPATRATASLLHELDLEELTAASPDEYVKLMTELAAAPERLKTLRQAIRPAMQRTVCDGVRFTRSLEHICTKLLKQTTCSVHTDREF